MSRLNVVCRRERGGGSKNPYSITIGNIILREIPKYTKLNHKTGSFNLKNEVCS